MRKEFDLKDHLKKFIDDSGATLVESLVSLVLLTTIIMPLIWFFMGNSGIFKFKKDAEIERKMYQSILKENLDRDSIKIAKDFYFLEKKDSLMFTKIILRDKKGLKVYEKTIIRD
jgi:hypothetical protein